MLYSTVESRKVHGDSRKAQVGPTNRHDVACCRVCMGLHLHHSTDGDAGRLSSTNNIFNNAAEFVYYAVKYNYVLFYIAIIRYTTILNIIIATL